MKDVFESKINCIIVLLLLAGFIWLCVMNMIMRDEIKDLQSKIPVVQTYRDSLGIASYYNTFPQPTFDDTNLPWMRKDSVK